MKFRARFGRIRNWDRNSFNPRESNLTVARGRARLSKGEAAGRTRDRRNRRFIWKYYDRVVPVPGCKVAAGFDTSPAWRRLVHARRPKDIRTGLQSCPRYPRVSCWDNINIVHSSSLSLQDVYNNNQNIERRVSLEISRQFFNEYSRNERTEETLTSNNDLLIFERLLACFWRTRLKRTCLRQWGMYIIYFIICIL